MCCGFSYSKTNKGAGIAYPFKKNFKSITGHNLIDIMVIMVADQAAIGLSTQLDLDGIESCDMRDGDNIGNSDKGNLIRSKNKRVLNLFPLAVTIINLATKGMTRFSYITHINNIHNIYKMADSHLFKPKVDKNSTRVASQHRLMKSLLSFNKCLLIYQVQNRVSIRDDVTATDADWQQFG